MAENKIFDNQFKMKKEEYLAKLDFIDWYRYFYIIKEVIDLKPSTVLEVGEGSGMVKNCLKDVVNEYKTIDINEKMSPDFLMDIRDENKELNKKFDCIIAADVLEHIPFSDLKKVAKSFYSYLLPGGTAIVTIPHRRSNFLFMTPTNVPHVVTVPTGFLSPGAFYRRFIKRKIWIDPHHCWEIGDGKVKKTDVDSVFRESGFKVCKFKKLFYVDFWVLEKN